VPLTVLSVGYPLAPVSPDAAGGAEQIVSLLDEALVARGHRSIVIAPEGSTVRGEHLPIPCFPGPLDDRAVAGARAATAAAIARALADHPIDLVHLHGVDAASYLPPPGPPALVTLHLPPSFYPPALFTPARPRTYLHAVSASQRRAFPADARLLPDIENGVPLDRLRPRFRKCEHVLALGRIAPEKGYEIALDAAARADLPLVLAGRVHAYEAHERYFEDAILPRLDRARRFLGPVGFARKRRLLASARCLVVPSLVPETSSLVAMEALACGTPVVASRIGALPDIVEHGVTGFLVDGLDEMAAAMRAAKTLDPRACRRAAEARFSAARMIDAYLALYARLAGGAP
jgi:glycosyltransferase involved in cell wall biosynthesis